MHEGADTRARYHNLLGPRYRYLYSDVVEKGRKAGGRVASVEIVSVGGDQKTRLKP